ncbi:MAG: 3-phosphoshikimate 1-carboxyvinyltransferase [Solirubrobacterales bacterium 70-9]|nr:MAG: 3-phosphoshikimate 1-carboxyvinyltransferase [Solirubrobacterales bacterium 70-9]
MHLYVRDTSGRLEGEISVPASKYHAHRALMLASLAEGESRIKGGVAAKHVQSTIEVLTGLGTQIEKTEYGFLVRGGLPYRPLRDTVSVGSSGTTLYFMIGLASLADAPVTITGQKYFQRRPVGPLLEALSSMGIELASANATPPITVQPQRPRGGRVSIAGTLSQWISGLLIVAPFASGPTTIEVEGTLNEQPYVELTVNMMRDFGLEVGVADDWRRFEIEPNQVAHPAEITLPPDIGSLAFGLAATSIPPSDVLFRGVNEIDGTKVDHPEAHFLDVAAEMGLPMELDPAAGGMRVRHHGVRLRGVEIDCRPMPDMLPVLSTMGQFAEGETRFSNVAHVRLKESDRVVSMLQLNRMGGDVEEQGDEFVVRGIAGELTGSPLSSFNDHRVHMALAVAASRAHGESSLTYPNAYRISYPGFLEDMQAIGLDLSIEDDRERSAAGVPVGAGEAESGQRAVESIAVDQAAEIPIVDWVGRWARERPGENAVVDVRATGTRVWTWEELDREADKAAALLLELGVEPGETVAYQLPNWGEFVILTLACMKVGAICCALMPIFREREIGFALRRSKARVLVVAEEFRGRRHAEEAAAMLAGAARGDGAATNGAGAHGDAAAGGGSGDDGPLGVEHVLVVGATRAAPALPKTDGARWHDFAAAVAGQEPDREAIVARKPGPTALSQLFFTSGSTGEPKGVLHRYDALTRAAMMEVEHLGLGRDDTIFIPTPLAHQTGLLYGMWLSFALGSTQVIQDVWDAHRGAAALREWDGTFVQAATPFLADLVRAVEAGEEVAPPALRIFVVTGAAVPRALAERATTVLSASVCGAWGSTESCLGALAAPGDDPAKVWGTDGRALAGTRIRIVDDSDNVLGPGEEGNFQVTSRCLFEEYLDRPDLTAAAMTTDGWYRTGDLATIDGDGYLRLTGRVKDIINRGGEKIPVAEIEQLLHQHAAVAEVAIVAMPDERLGERACAFVVRDPDFAGAFGLAEVREWLDSQEMSKHYWPERVETIEQMPRTPSGKIQKFVLRERAKGLRPEPHLMPSETEEEPVR